MSIRTLDLADFEKRSSSVYEACLIIARRARKINSDRIAKRKEKEIMEESGYDQDLDVYDREFLEGIDYEKEINPTVIAQDELFEGKIKYRYITEEEDNLTKLPSE
jgi:DNA-directed RNA polymerase subunit K/omega